MNNHNSIKVAIQGIPGSNHDIAAQGFFRGDKVIPVPCLSFTEVFQSIKFETSTYGIIAIENTLVGSLLNNYTLLKNYGYKVFGEYKLRIKHQLMALPGQGIEDIYKVYSHPMALAQCQAYFKNYPHIQLIESEDTAYSARWIKEQQKQNVAAIAPALAAELYELEIIERDIETNKSNYTRFLAIGNQEHVANAVDVSKVNKSSLVCSLPHKEGSLLSILNIFKDNEINLTKIQSLPLVGKEWEYLFYIDVMFNSSVQYNQALDAISPLCNSIKELGVYEVSNLLHK